MTYRMPAEWEKHEATWLSWPKDPKTFPQEIIARVEKTFARMAIALQDDEKVNILVNDSNWENKARAVLDKVGAADKNIRFFHITSADVWARDYAPIFARDSDGAIAAIKWIYNAYGNKYEDLLMDDKTGESIAQASGKKVIHPGIVLEGGSVDVNGQGRMLSTEQCLLNKNRNPQLTRAQIEKYLGDFLGAKEVIWLKDGIEGDDTDGHVDDITRFFSKDAVITATENNASDSNHKALEENLGILDSAGLEMVKLPMPKRIDIPERRLPVSYANFYIANKRVLLPVFGDKNDKVAAEILQSCFKGREIVPIDAKDLVYGYGGIHCATMQQPAL